MAPRLAGPRQASQGCKKRMLGGREESLRELETPLPTLSSPAAQWDWTQGSPGPAACPAHRVTWRAEGLAAWHCLCEQLARAQLEVGVGTEQLSRGRMPVVHPMPSPQTGGNLGLSWPVVRCALSAGPGPQASGQPSRGFTKSSANSTRFHGTLQLPHTLLEPGAFLGFSCWFSAP